APRGGGAGGGGGGRRAAAPPPTKGRAGPPPPPRLWQQLERDGQLSLRIWQSVPHDRLDELADLGIAGGLGGDRLRLGYLKAFMDGTLRSRTALMLDRTGVQITTPQEPADLLRP